MFTEVKLQTSITTNCYIGNFRCCKL